MKQKLTHISLFLIVATLLVVTVSFAGSLTPPGSPSKTMKSLSDLYELINTGSNTPANNFTTPGTVSSTMNSIGDIYDLMTTKISDIDATKILTGTSIFGVSGIALGPVEWAAADMPGGIQTWADGVSYCNNSTEEGHSDWRIPHLWELIKMLSEGNSAGFLDNFYWSDQVTAGNPDLVYTVYRVGPDVVIQHVTQNPRLVRCVR